jgi:exopolysaccharide biosynthesis polyprenyl glycosylphosphotransferase
VGVVEPIAKPAPQQALRHGTISRERTRTREHVPSAATYRDAAYRRFLAAADGLGVIAVLAAVTWAAAGAGSLKPGALMTIPLAIALAKVIGLYERDQTRLHKETLDEVPLLFYLASMVTLLAFVGQSVVLTGELDEVAVASMCALLTVALVCTRTAARAIVARVSTPERCLLVGDEAIAVKVASKIHAQGLRAELVSVVEPPPDSMNGDASEQLISRILPLLEHHEIERVILASRSWDDDELIHAIDDLGAWGVKVSVLPPHSTIAALSFDLDQLPGMSLLGMHSFAISRSSLVVKRIFDLVVSTLTLTLLSPLLLITAIAIKLDSPGPILFRQTRVGREGRQFSMLKFRSMVDGADGRKDELEHPSNGNGLFKLEDDPRVTRVGKLIRRYSIDELPQIVNVLIGQMSLVGPRPLIPREDAMIEGKFRRRLNALPGITGHWQILGSLRVPLDEMVRLDYLYVANWSLWTDIKLLIRTFRYLALRGNV